MARRRRSGGITIKSRRDLNMMVEAGQIVARAKANMMKAAEPGIETRELDAIAEKTIRKLGAVPSFKGYNPGMSMPYAFPATICASLNEEIVHGIPSRREG